jgi:hypothetical protein
MKVRDKEHWITSQHNKGKMIENKHNKGVSKN